MTGHEQFTQDLLAPIPLELPSVAGWKEVPLRESGEPLVALGAFSDYEDIFTSSVYVGEHSNSPYWSEDRKLDGALTTIFLRASVASALRDAQQLLPKGQYLIVFDGFRPLLVQTALYEHYLKKLTIQRPDWSAEALSSETQRYVSIPSRDQSKPSPHTTGGSVDLAILELPPEQEQLLQQTDARIEELQRRAPKDFTPEDEARNPILRELYLQQMTRQSIIRRYARMLPFGSAFDYGGEAAGANYLERQALERMLKQDEQTALNNRRLLYNVMLAVGLQPYADEWWHFNSPKSQMGAKAAGLDHAEYCTAALSTENQAHETMRDMHRRGLAMIEEARMRGQQATGRGALQEFIDLNVFALEQVGHPRIGFEIGAVKVIEPPDKAA